MVEVDASLPPGGTDGFYGIIVRDSNGGFIAARSGPIRCLKDPHLAETFAVKEALSWTLEQGWHNILLKSDCCVLKYCRSLKRHFESMSIQYINRSVNKLAHVLARAASSHTGHLNWFSNIPSCIEHLIA
ncbi:PREDICTED: uncharacterized protein LOC109180249 [Ipomoea nil]|uniref:uncharacterized protein LOC109180249 n=1 Tax=Ipomoea nil TaxID=35883 RepID=UPI000900AFA4|nr:PREDICTED: uncharacterized protein LOC109180249 [Ipomoea nil]